eukprot:TRINITY_DN8221_c0_g1_i1.p1 TRINITY_DN8221_c0_g1~~TRINITY_DN8221_c0_g1_i1.p1  ORF type:complete len:579 (-),score=97.88 TRINITY_DN8221_c0_g1_i1:474-2210(-)
MTNRIHGRHHSTDLPSLHSQHRKDNSHEYKWTLRLISIEGDIHKKFKDTPLFIRLTLLGASERVTNDSNPAIENRGIVDFEKEVILVYEGRTSTDKTHVNVELFALKKKERLIGCFDFDLDNYTKNGKDKVKCDISEEVTYHKYKLQVNMQLLIVKKNLSQKKSSTPTKPRKRSGRKLTYPLADIPDIDIFISNDPLPDLKSSNESISVEKEKKYPSLEGRVTRVRGHGRAISDEGVDPSFQKIKFEKAMKYLKDNVICADIYSPFVVSLVSYKSIIHWTEFKDVKDIIINSIVHNFYGLPIDIMVKKLSMLLNIYYYFNSQKHQNKMSSQYKEEIKEVISELYEILLTQLEIILKPITVDVISSLWKSTHDIYTMVVQDIKEVGIFITELLNILQMIRESIAFQSVYNSIILHLSDVFLNISVSVISSLNSSYTKSLFLKMLFTHLYEWFEEQAPPCSENLFTRLKEVSNVLSFPSKDVVLDLRDALWPNLSPKVMIEILSSYKSDKDDDQIIPKSVYEGLEALGNNTESERYLDLSLMEKSVSVLQKAEIPEHIMHVPSLNYLSARFQTESSEESW